ncbi:MAG: lycopene cyclase domain-containing protein [Cytophagales bacterium]|nr:lycopene cyclase domain-containing protein [Armatimonadota bacterium]
MPFGSATYLLILTLWAAPVILLQWIVAGRALWRARRLLLASITLCTVYLSVADAIAIARGIWQIHAEGVTGIRFGSHLPLEEALFYFLTVIMSAQGFIMIAGYFRPKREPF